MFYLYKERFHYFGPKKGKFFQNVRNIISVKTRFYPLEDSTVNFVICLLQIFHTSEDYVVLRSARTGTPFDVGRNMAVLHSRSGVPALHGWAQLHMGGEQRSPYLGQQALQQVTLLYIILSESYFIGLLKTFCAT